MAVRAGAGEEGSAAVLLLRGHIAAARGLPEEALALYAAVIAEPAHRSAAPAALLASGRIHAATENSEELLEVLDRLRTEFPASPECALVAALAGTPMGVRVEPLAKPSEFLGPFVAVAPTVEKAPDVPLRTAAAAAGMLGAADKPRESTPTPSAEPEGAVAVLAGSYTSEQNAQSRASDLASRGIEAHVSTAMVKERQYFRVIVGEPTTYEEASRQVLVLKDRGIESVLLFLE